jgi:hypothetical protein
MASRDEILRAGITKADKIIEIGPSYNPLAPKAQGWRSYALDHADRDSLVEKYRHDPSVNVEMIERVDFVWTGGPLVNAVPVEHHGTFDVFVACHVLEHIPDLVGLFRSAEVLCRPDARMILALPDKRVCFDFFRPLSTTGDALAAHWEGRSRHTPETLWDTFAYNATKQGNPGWGRTDRAQLTLTHPIEQAHAITLKYTTAEYIDAHAWTFVPASFSLIMLELAHFRLIDWQVERTQAADYTEFYVWLRRGAAVRSAHTAEPDLVAERMRLLNEVMLELHDQGRQLSSAEDIGVVGPLEKVKAELAATRSTLDLIRSSRAWRTRSALRKLLRLPTTLADA